MGTYASARVRAEIDAAWARLARHAIEPFDGRCTACGQSAPCPVANDAANLLAEMGQRLCPRTPVVPRAPLLSYAWHHFQFWRGHR